jgi:predicted CoA-binding protein
VLAASNKLPATSDWLKNMTESSNRHDLIDEMLRKSRNIAVVGMSDKPHRASFNIGRYLAGSGYRIFPVNPALHEALGRPSHPDLDAAQAAARAETGQGIDLVDVFRASEHVPDLVDDVIRLGIPYLWLQDGVINDGAVARARAAGVKCIQNDCIFREHAARPQLHTKRS